MRAQIRIHIAHASDFTHAFKCTCTGAGSGFTQKCLTYEPLASRAEKKGTSRGLNRNVSLDSATRGSMDWILGVSWIIAKVKSSVHHIVAAQQPMINDHSALALRDTLPLAIRPQDPPHIVGSYWLRHHESHSINFCVFALTHMSCGESQVLLN